MKIKFNHFFLANNFLASKCMNSSLLIMLIIAYRKEKKIIKKASYVIYGLRILVSLHHLLMKFRVRYFGADGDTALNGVLNFPDHALEFGRCVRILGGHT